MLSRASRLAYGGEALVSELLPRERERARYDLMQCVLIQWLRSMEALTGGLSGGRA